MANVGRAADYFEIDFVEPTIVYKGNDAAGGDFYVTNSKGLFAVYDKAARIKSQRIAIHGNDGVFGERDDGVIDEIVTELLGAGEELFSCGVWLRAIVRRMFSEGLE